MKRPYVAPLTALLTALAACLALTFGALAAPWSSTAGPGEAAAAGTGVATQVWSNPVAVEGLATFSLTMRNVQPGRYLATLDGLLVGPDKSTLACRVRRAGRPGIVMGDLATADGLGTYSIRFSRQLTVTKVRSLVVECSGGQPESWRSYPGVPFQVTLTRIDRLTPRAFVTTPAPNVPRPRVG